MCGRPHGEVRHGSAAPVGGSSGHEGAERGDLGGEGADGGDGREEDGEQRLALGPGEGEAGGGERREGDEGGAEAVRRDREGEERQQQGATQAAASTRSIVSATATDPPVYPGRIRDQLPRTSPALA